MAEENSEKIDEEIMELIKKAKQRKKGILPGPEPELAGKEKTKKPGRETKKREETEPHVTEAGYRRRYLERVKRRREEGLVPETPPSEYTPPVPKPGEKEEAVPSVPKEMVYSPPVLPAEIEEELKLPEKEETVGLMKQLQELEAPEKEACATCGAVNSKKYYCPYCGKQFCTSCAKVLEKKDGTTVYECPNCHRRVVIEEPEKQE